ncbi:MAG: hypothetical protein OEY19_09050 [Gammaproteobacteria bacterium]|nr:hypothetical protein [Gammaproteobacteria bacterium]MDH5630023.1 hypothetical protein [Gammaproteobacteria bacterium]
MSDFYIWPDMPGLSVTVLVVGSMIFLYLARTPLHLALDSLNDGIAGGLHKISDWINGLVEKMREKNRKVLLESSIADSEQKIAQEFKKVESSYIKHLADYPKLHLKLDESISKIDEDYKECGQAVPEAPGWNDAVQSIASIKGAASNDRVIEKMLKELHKSAVDGEKQALNELRKTASQRHKVLSSMAPIWKKILKLMGTVETQVTHVIETTRKIDKYMKDYNSVLKGGEDSIDMLGSKATKLFVFSVLVIVVAGFGAFVNFNLIALPMSELVPAGNRVMGMQVSDISALVIVTLEIVLGIFLMEALGITNIFPQVGSMTSSKKKLLLYASLLGLFFLASVEAALAVLREHIAETNAATTQALAGATEATGGAGNSQITVIGQATLGFVLPWILAMVAVPLEMLIESAQHALYKFLILIVLLVGYVIRTIGHIVQMIMKTLIHIYDAYIIVPAKIGEMITGESSVASRKK